MSDTNNKTSTNEQNYTNNDNTTSEEETNQEYPEDEEVGELPEGFDPNEYDIMDADELIDKIEALGEGDVALTEEEANEEGFVSEAKSVFSGHTDSVLAIDINKHNYPQVCTGGVDDRAFLFNIEEGTIDGNEQIDKEQEQEQEDAQNNADTVGEEAIIEEISGFHDSIVDVAFSASGKYLAVAAYDGEIRIYNNGGKLLKTLNGPSDIEYIQWHNKGEILTSGGGDGTVYVWGIPSGTIINVLSGHVDAVTCAAFNHTGNIYVTGSIDGSIKVWKIKTGELLHTFKLETFNWHEDGIVSLAINPEAPIMVSGSRDGVVCLTNLKQYKIIYKYDHKQPDMNCSIETVGFCNTNNWVASGGMDGTIKIYDIELSKFRHTLTHDGGVTRLLWHPFKPILFSTCLDGCIYVWDARTGEKLKQIRAHNDIILDMDIYVPPQNLNITYIVTGSDDHTCQLFKVEA